MEYDNNPEYNNNNGYNGYNDNANRCPYCGQEIPQGADSCGHCGAQLQNNEMLEDPYFDETLKHRAGCISAFLSLSLVGNALYGFMCLYSIIDGRGLYTRYEPMWIRTWGLIGSVLAICGLIGLLRWKKSGFYVMALICLVNLFANIAMDLGMGSINLLTFSPIVSLLVLYLVLQVKSDGESCWDNLS